MLAFGHEDRNSTLRFNAVLYSMIANEGNHNYNKM